MAFDTGIFTDLDDANTIADPEILVRADAVKLPMNLGRFWNDMMGAPAMESNRKFEIYSRTETQRAGTVGTGGWTNGTTTTSLPVTDASGLTRGLIMQVEDEVVVIKEVDTGGNTVDVWRRGAAGTTGAAHVVTTEYTIIGSAMDDVDFDSIEAINESTNVYENYMQTVGEAVDYTKGGRIDVRKGLTDNVIATQEEEAMTRVARGIYSTSINGKKANKDRSAGEKWQTAGMIQQLTDTTGGRLTLTYDAAGVLTETKLRDALRIVTERGMPTDIYVSSANKDTINEFLHAASGTTISTNTELTNTQAGYHVDTYNYEGIILNVKIDLGMPNDQIAIVNINKCMKGWKAGDELVLSDVETNNPRTMKGIYNGSFFIAIDDVGYEHIMITGITQA